MMKDCNGHFDEYLHDMKCMTCDEYNECYDRTVAHRKTIKKEEAWGRRRLTT